MWLIIASSPNLPSIYYLADNSDSALAMIEGLQYFCWHVEVEMVQKVNAL